jgi:ABC-2 type transport system permease protein
VNGFETLLGKELLEARRTMRLLVVLALFLFVGLSSPLLARFLPEILELAAGDLGGSFPVPTPTAADAVSQVLKNIGQFGAFAAIVLAMGAVAGEIERGTAAFVLARPVRRRAFLAAKAVSLGLILALGVALAVAVGWVYTAILFEPQPVAGWIALGLLAWLGLAAWAAITFLASTVTGSAAAAAGLGFVALLGLSIASAVPAIARLTPAGLTAPALALGAGTATIDELGADLWSPVAATIVLIAGCLVLAGLAFRRREL